KNTRTRERDPPPSGSADQWPGAEQMGLRLECPVRTRLRLRDGFRADCGLPDPAPAAFRQWTRRANCPPAKRRERETFGRWDDASRRLEAGTKGAYSNEDERLMPPPRLPASCP